MIIEFRSDKRRREVAGKGREGGRKGQGRQGVKVRAGLARV